MCKGGAIMFKLTNEIKQQWKDYLLMQWQQLCIAEREFRKFIDRIIY
jgi:hypothetical protein